MSVKWVKIFGSIDEALERVPPGRPRLLVVNGIRICLVNRRGDFRAMQDACPHNGEWLSKGTINYLGEVICPWHHYRFDPETGRECLGRTVDLRIYPLKLTEAGFYIGL